MSSQQLQTVVSYLRRVLAPLPGSDRDDGQLLERAGQGDEAAFAALVQRHGSLVWRVCRNLLGHEQDAEDAFQASFLVLARKAKSIRKKKSLPCWLYGVAHRIAMKTRKSEAQRSAREKKAASPRQSEEPPTVASLHELQAIVDEEVGRLSEKYRRPFVLCCLEGKSKPEAARELGWKEGTVSGRLARARALLQQRLAQRGVALSAALSAVALQPEVSLSAPLIGGTVRAAVAFASSKAVPAGLISAKVLSVANFALRSMFLAKAKSAFGVLLLAGVSMGVSGLAFRTQAADNGTRTVEDAKPKSDASVSGDIRADDKEPEGAEQVKGTNALKLSLSADKSETLMKPDGSNAVPVNLKLTFTNGGDKDVTLNAHVLKWRMRLRCTGPSPDSVKSSSLYIKRPRDFLPQPAAKDSVMLQPGKSWSPDWTLFFPGDPIDEGFAKAVIYVLRKPGTYKLQLTLYEKLLAGDEPEAKLTPWLESNEFELKVRKEDLDKHIRADTVTAWRQTGAEAGLPKMLSIAIVCAGPIGSLRQHSVRLTFPTKFAPSAQFETGSSPGG